MLQRTVEAALAAFKLPQLKQDTVMDSYKHGGHTRGEKVSDKHFEMTCKLVKGYIFLWSVEGQAVTAPKYVTKRKRVH